MSVPDHSAMHPAIVKTTVWTDEADTRFFAQRLARALLTLPEPGNALIELRGNLGAGKTTLARYLLQALGVSGRIKSPSYAVVETYPLTLPSGPLAVSHLDFYRLDDAQEWEDAGFRELFASPGLKLVEWPERVAALMPTPDLRLFIESAPAQDGQTGPRQVRLEALSAGGRALVASLP